MSSPASFARTPLRYVIGRWLLSMSCVLLPASAMADDLVPPGPRDPNKSTVSKDASKEIDKDKDGHIIEEREYDASVLPKVLKKKITYAKYHKNGKVAEMSIWHATVTDDIGRERADVTETYTYDDKGGELEKVVRHKGKSKYYKWVKIPGTGSGNWERDAEREQQEKEKEKEKKPDKKKRETSLPSPNETAVYFHGGELEINTFAIWAIGDAQKTVTHKRTVRDTRTVTRDRTVQRTELVDIPGIPGLTEVTMEVVEPVQEKETFRRTVRESEQEGPFDDQAFGLGVDAKYFFNPNIGAGAEVNWLFGDHTAFTFAATVTVRFPCESCHLAPYFVGGLGGQCADTNRLIGFVGAGLMKRFSPSCGAFIEGRYRFDGDEENVCEIRTGISVAFGHRAEPSGQTLEIERRPRGTAADTWDRIDPITKDLRR